MFAPVRWTNLYFPTRWLLQGDPVGGPLAGLFGPGVRDVAVKTTRRGGLLAHTQYWNFDAPGTPGQHVEALWAALDIGGDAGPAPKTDPSSEPGGGA